MFPTEMYLESDPRISFLGTLYWVAFDPRRERVGVSEPLKSLCQV